MNNTKIQTLLYKNAFEIVYGARKKLLNWELTHKIYNSKFYFSYYMRNQCFKHSFYF